MDRPVVLILTGATANARRIAACQELAREIWPEAQVFMPNYLSRFRGLRGVGAWLERWLRETLPPGESLYVFAFILGGAALPYAPTLVARAQRR